MSANFQLAFSKRNGNLHVKASGDFDGSSAWELVNLLHEHYDGKGRVFIDTRNLRELCPFGCRTFQGRLNPARVPSERLFFKGDKGRELAPEGSRVISAPAEATCRCSGNCVQCQCAREKQEQHSTT